MSYSDSDSDSCSVHSDSSYGAPRPDNFHDLDWRDRYIWQMNHRPDDGYNEDRYNLIKDNYRYFEDIPEDHSDSMDFGPDSDEFWDDDPGDEGIKAILNRIKPRVMNQPVRRWRRVDQVYAAHPQTYNLAQHAKDYNRAWRDADDYRRFEHVKRRNPRDDARKYQPQRTIPEYMRYPKRLPLMADEDEAELAAALAMSNDEARIADMRRRIVALAAERKRIANIDDDEAELAEALAMSIEEARGFVKPDRAEELPLDLRDIPPEALSNILKQLNPNDKVSVALTAKDLATAYGFDRNVKHQNFEDIIRAEEAAGIFRYNRREPWRIEPERELILEPPESYHINHNEEGLRRSLGGGRSRRRSTKKKIKKSRTSKKSKKSRKSRKSKST